MQKIVSHLWYNNQALDAVNFYSSIFNDSKVLDIKYYSKQGSIKSGMKPGDVMSVHFQLEGQEFIALNGGPAFRFTPAISFYVNCESKVELKYLWNQLSLDGQILMELNQYPFSSFFGWLQDKYGVSWQLNLKGRKQKITPFLMFFGKNYGKAGDAINLYTSLFENSNINNIDFNEEDKTIIHSLFTLAGQEFMAIDSSFPHRFTFTEAFSFLVKCDNQDEVNRLWDKFCSEGKEGKCGWLKDKFGVSWQIVPVVLEELLESNTEKVMEELLSMKKIEIKKLQNIE